MTVIVVYLELPTHTRQPAQAPLKVSLIPLQPQALEETIEELAVEQSPVEPATPSPEVTTNQVAASASVEPVSENPVKVVETGKSTASVDWYAAMEEHTSENPVSMGHLSPLAAAKEAAQKKYAPVGKRKEIWDYVEKDPYGRTLLKAGDCYRVLDDPHLPTIDIFENFTRFLVFCRNVDRSEISMDGLDEILKRYKYLQPPP